MPAHGLVFSQSCSWTVVSAASPSAMQNFILKHRDWTHLPPRVLTRGPITCERVDSLKIIAWPEPLGLQSPVPEVSLAPGQASSLLLGHCAAKNQNTGPWGPSPGGEEGHEIKSEPFGNKEFVHSAPNTHGPWHQEPQHSSEEVPALHILLGIGDKAC